MTGIINPRIAGFLESIRKLSFQYVEKNLHRKALRQIYSTMIRTQAFWTSCLVVSLCSNVCAPTYRSVYTDEVTANQIASSYDSKDFF